MDHPDAGKGTGPPYLAGGPASCSSELICGISDRGPWARTLIINPRCGFLSRGVLRRATFRNPTGKPGTGTFCMGPKFSCCSLV